MRNQSLCKHFCLRYTTHLLSFHSLKLLQTVFHDSWLSNWISSLSSFKLLHCFYPLRFKQCNYHLILQVWLFGIRPLLGATVSNDAFGYCAPLFSLQLQPYHHQSDVIGISACVNKHVLNRAEEPRGALPFTQLLGLISLLAA